MRHTGIGSSFASNLSFSFLRYLPWWCVNKKPFLDLYFRHVYHDGVVARNVLQQCWTCVLWWCCCKKCPSAVYWTCVLWWCCCKKCPSAVLDILWWCCCKKCPSAVLDILWRCCCKKCPFSGVGHVYCEGIAARNVLQQCWTCVLWWCCCKKCPSAVLDILWWCCCKKCPSAVYWTCVPW